MIDGMLIAGFKGFPYEWNYLPIRPITLLFGQNGAGKSSLLQAMAWMNHIQNGGNFDANQLSMTGTHVKLGGYNQFSNRTDPFGISCGQFPNGQTIGLGWGFRFADPFPAPGPAEGICLLDQDPQPMPFQWGLSYEFYETAGICNVRIYCGPLTLCWDTSNMDEVSDSFSFSGFVVNENVSPMTVKSVVGYLRATSGRKEQPESWTEEWCEEFLAFIHLQLTKSRFSLDGVSPRLEMPKIILGKGARLAKTFLRDLQVAVDQMATDVRTFLGGMRYLGPWRHIPNLKKLPKIGAPSVHEELRLWRNVLEDEEILIGLNEWITKLDSNLRVVVQKNKLVLCLAPSNEEISPENTGVGISQLVPIIVAALSRNSQTWLVEQPELHLHPKAQALLGDMFIQATVPTLSPHHFFIVETHSEHLILRLLRRVRETCQLFMKNNYPLHPEELSVVYVGRIAELDSKTYEETMARGENPFPEDGILDTKEELDIAKRDAVRNSRITAIPVTSQGDFEIKWPGGFFEERLDEMFSDNELERWFKKPSP